jgi:CubicO group peptidase (beta-lactamase class C family)
MNKMFTAVAVAQLANAGKLGFFDALGKFLPDYPSAATRQVTIHQLLTHTGGTGDIFGPEFTWANRDKINTLEDFVRLYGKRDPEFEPGSRWRYSNYGYVLLDLVVEKVSVESYSDYFREHIFTPAGMNSTTAGGGYSTVEDLLGFANALLNHKLLDADYTQLVTTGKVDTGRGDRYAYGFVDRVQQGVRWFGHEGGIPGANGYLRVYPESGYVVAVLANLDPPAATEVADFIGQRLPTNSQ